MKIPRSCTDRPEPPASWTREVFVELEGSSLAWCQDVMTSTSRQQGYDMTGARPHGNRPSSDLVWDGGLHATAFVDDGAPLTAGADVGWTPELLVATAAGTALMTIVLRLATEAGVEILGYVSEQRLHGPSDNGCPGILVSPCISARSAPAADAIRALVAQAIDLARDSGTLSRDLTVEPQVTVVAACGGRW